VYLCVCVCLYVLPLLIVSFEMASHRVLRAGLATCDADRNRIRQRSIEVLDGLYECVCECVFVWVHVPVDGSIYPPLKSGSDCARL
jgi:hypothetical protein